MIEVKTPLTHRDYSHLVDQEVGKPFKEEWKKNLYDLFSQDPLHLTINKIRRCFMYNNQYFQLDIYKEPCHPRYSVMSSKWLNADLLLHRKLCFRTAFTQGQTVES